MSGKSSRLASTQARTTPWSPFRSERASAERPSSAARATSSSGWLAPSRKEKQERQRSSA